MIFADAGFLVGACCINDVTVDVFGVAAADAKGGFTVFGMPHIYASVVLTTFRFGFVGSHICALSSGDIDLLTELPVCGDAADNVGEEDDC